jgi:hypothetical protein
MIERLISYKGLGVYDLYPQNELYLLNPLSAPNSNYTASVPRASGTASLKMGDRRYGFIHTQLMRACVSIHRLGDWTRCGWEMN